jgi:hypothetical protein
MREWLTPWLPSARDTLFKQDNAKNVRYGLFLREHTRPPTTVALFFAGIPAFFGERVAIDVLGRSDAHIAKLEVERFLPGHSKTDWDYVLERKPSIFLRDGGGLAEHPEFRFGYVLRKLPTGEPFWVRRGDEDLLAP